MPPKNIFSKESVAIMAKIDEKHSDLLSKLADISTQLATANQEIATLKESVKVANNEIVLLKEENAVLKEENKDLKAKFTGINDRLLNIENKNPTGKIVLRGNSLNTDAEDYKNEFDEVISNKLRIPKDKLKDVTYTRLGQNSHGIIATVPDGGLRGEFFKSARTTRPTDFYVSEFLTRDKDRLFHDIRRKKKEREINIFSVFSFHGRIYVKKLRESQKQLIEQISDLDRL